MSDRYNKKGISIKEYGKKLFAFIRGKVSTEEEAEDILQDVWYQLYNSSEAIEEVGAWLYRVAKNKIIDRYRKKKPELLDDQGYEDEEGEWHLKEILLADPSNPESEYLKNLFWKELNKGLNEMPPEQKEVFVLNELEGLTFAEIAARTGENIKTLISRKGYAVKHLRARLQTLYDEFLNY
jgi:RNA polymerase sigma factor (sigma-70 family)